MKPMKIFSRYEFNINPACYPFNPGIIVQETKALKVKSKKRKSHSGDAGASGNNEKKSNNRIEHLNYKVRILRIGVG